MKKIINEPENLVVEMCEGIVAAHPNQLNFKKRYKLLTRKKFNSEKVTLISGGGSGHEPAHAGYVGEGMLDVAVCGDVFASPSTIQVYNAIVDSESKKGTLLIIKNYSGDIMNFEAAAEMADEDDDIKVEKVYVNDDVAVKDSLYTVGRRGVAGSVFVHKIAGAAAEKGLELLEVKEVAQKVIKNVKSIGFALTSCTVPAKGTPTFVLGEDEIEFGVGIHGEPGVAREKVKSSDELALECVDRVLKELPDDNKEVVVMINGFGSTPLQELYVFNNSVSKLLKERNIKVYDTLVGNYMTALDMAGASLTILKLDEELKSLYDAKADTLAFKK